MVRIVYGALAAILLGVAGFFGFQFYTQHRAISEVDAAFERIRATGAKASHGAVSFDLHSRTVTISDIAGETAAQPPISFKIANITASGVSQPDATQFHADAIEATDIDIDLAMAASPAMNLTYKIPRIAVKEYSGPASLQQSPQSSSFADVYRFLLEQFARVSATSITIPSVAGTINLGAATPGGGNVTYSGLAMQDIRDGKVASTKVDSFVFTISLQQAGKTEKLNGNLANFIAYDVDINAMAAIFDPQKANDDRYYRAYRQISAGPYIITSGQGLNMQIDAMTIDDVGFRPSRIQLPALVAMMPPAGAAPPTPAQLREIMEKVAKLYEGMRIGNAEIRGLLVKTPEGPLKLSAMRFNFEAGKIGEFALEGLDTGTANGPVKIGRFALKSLDISNLMRITAQFAAQKPSPDQMLALMPLIEGVEIKDFVAPFRNTGKPIKIDTARLNWGQFIGPIPSKAHLAVKMSAPLDATSAQQKLLLAVGLEKAAVDLDLGAAWTETSASFALGPVVLDLDDVLNATARISLANVPKGIFSTDLAQAMAAAAQIEAGTVELTLRDTGGLDLAVAQNARSQNVSREAARSAIVDSIKAESEKATAANPDAEAAVEALARFVETSGQTLVIKLTPVGKVPALQLMQLLKTDPMTALAQFRIEASTGL